MAGKNDIKAGGAFIELFVKDAKLRSGLKSAGGAVQAFGMGIAALGGVMSAAGAAIVAPLATSVRHFVQAGSALQDMSGRTGVAVDELSFLKYAAEQTGTSLEVVEAAIRNLEKKGIDPSNLQRIAEQLSAIPDPATRAAKAMEVFGKSGTSLLPMLSNLRGLRTEFEALGIAITPEEAKRADELGDAFDRLGAVWKRSLFQIGLALQPMLQPIVEAVTAIAVAVKNFSEANPGATRFLAIAGVLLVTLGPLVLVAGLFVIKLGALVMALTSIIAVAPAVIAFLTANAAAIGIVIAAIAVLALTVAEVGYWLLFTKHGQAAMRAIRQALAGVMATLADFTKATRVAFGGMADAIAAGDIELAWQILLKGMEAQWHAFTAEVLKGLAMIVDEIEERLFGGVLARIADLSGDLSTEAILKESARGEGLKSQLALVETKRLAAQAAAAASSGGSMNPSDPRYGTAARGATVIGTNARAALMSGNIMGTGNNPVVDAINRMIKFSEREAAYLASIDRKTVHRGMR